MSFEDLQMAILKNVVNNNQKEGFTALTGEKGAVISKEDLIKRIKEINPAYVEVMETEFNILVRQGLIEEVKVMFRIPNWDNFISSIDAFYEVCYKLEDE